MNGKTQYTMLTNAYTREHLIDQGRKNGVSWQEEKDPNINWFRFSIALVKHLDKGNAFHTDDADAGSLKALLDNYKVIQGVYKKMMVPHLRAAMSKLASERGSDTEPMELLGEAYKHLSNTGGESWAKKVSDLSMVNSQIKYLSSRLGQGEEPRLEPVDDANGDNILEDIEEL